MSERLSKPRRGFREDTPSLQDESEHIATMNKNAQWTLNRRQRQAELPYYDEVKLTVNGRLITPPADKRLSDTLVFLIIGHNTVAKRNLFPRNLSDSNDSSSKDKKEAETAEEAAF